MKVYRIAQRNFIEDLSGEGARLFGGRWNHKGTSLLYTAESRSLAALEILVHAHNLSSISSLATLILEIPDNVVIDDFFISAVKLSPLVIGISLVNLTV